MVPLLQFVHYLIQLYIYVIFATVILSWLLAFGIINNNNNFVYSLQRALYAITEPVLAPIRRIMPDLGGIDISPIIALLGCIFLQQVVIVGWMIPLFS